MRRCARHGLRSRAIVFLVFLQTLNLAKGSPEPHSTKVAKISEAQLREIAEKKMNDLNANDIDAAANIIAGTARSMGVEVV